MLPSEFRERVFEPAFADLILEEAAVKQGNRRMFLGVFKRLLFLLNCFRLAMPQIFWHRGKVTKIARRMAAAFVAVALIVAYIATRAAYTV